MVNKTSVLAVRSPSAFPDWVRAALSLVIGVKVWIITVA